MIKLPRLKTEEIIKAGDTVRVKEGVWMPSRIPKAVRDARIGKARAVHHNDLVSVAFPGMQGVVHYYMNELQRCN